MTIALYDSQIFGPLFADQQVTELFSDQRRIDVMLQVEVALAKAQADVGVIPRSAAAAIEHAAAEFTAELTSIGSGTRRTGVPVIDLLHQFSCELDQQDRRYLHYGATSQDIVDTALVIHIRDAIDLFYVQLDKLVHSLASLANKHRHTPMPARTRSQQALPTTFGLKAAAWLTPLVRHRQRLRELEPRVLVLQFGGAVGTLAALGEQGMKVATELATRLELALPVMSWHTQRDNLAEFASWLSLTSGSVGKMGQDIVLMSQSEVGEVAENNQEQSGTSSTMPHKSNPINSEMLVTAARMNTTLLNNMHHALLADHERATHSWQLEWNTLPQMTCCTGTALARAAPLLDNLIVNEKRMRQNLEDSNGLLLAEAATFALIEHMDRGEAESIVKAACAEVANSGRHLLDVLQQTTSCPVPWEHLRDPSGYLGQTDVLIDRVLATLD